MTDDTENKEIEEADSIEQQAPEDVEKLKEKGISPVVEEDKEEEFPEPKEEEPVKIEEEEPEIKEESTLNNNPLESSGPKSEKPINPDKDALSTVVDKNSPLQTVITRNKFYIDGYRTLQKVALVESLAILFLVIAFLVLFAFSRPQDNFFATTSDGKLIKLAPLSSPSMKKPEVLNFAASSAAEVMTFGFHDYRSRLQESSRNFTTRGWESFLTALNDANYIETITTNRQVISAVPISTPVIIAEGLDKDIYKWSIEVPLSISIESGSQIANKKILVKMVVSRRSKVESDNALGIDQWVTASYK